MLTRRRLIRAGGFALAGLALARGRVRAKPRAVIDIRMRSTADGARVWFDPVGLLIAPGQTLRWVTLANVHTTTAYHPDNDDHPLRIPRHAAPWDSGYLVNPGDSFEVTLAVEGVYDYFCNPHEAAGMVGRIIVGRPVGPGALPFDYFVGDPEKRHWRRVPEAARRNFPPAATIVERGIVRGTPGDP